MAATVGTENGMQAETTSDLTGRVSNLEVSGELLNPEVSEEDKQRAEKQKEIANEYFKSMIQTHSFSKTKLKIKIENKI